MNSKKDDLQDRESRLKNVCYNLQRINKVKASLIRGELPLRPADEAN